MYRNSFKVNMTTGDMRLQRRVLLIACLVLLIGCIVLSVIAARSSTYQHRAENQFNQRMISAAASAIDEVNRMSGLVTSNTTSRLARVRQYVYTMEQINAISISLSGEGARLAPDEAFTALYGDLDTFESLAQAATTSTMDARTSLLAHLTTLQSILTGP